MTPLGVQNELLPAAVQGLIFKEQFVIKGTGFLDSKTQRVDNWGCLW